MATRSSLKDRTVAGALWTVATSIGGRAVGLLGTLALTRFVDPDEYGTISIAAVIVTTVNAVTTLGFGQYVVANPKEGSRTTFHATVYHLGLGVFALSAVLLLSGALAALFDAPELDHYMPAMILGASLDRLAYVPGRVLARDMRFKVLGLRLLLGEVAYVTFAVALAAAGWRSAALVGGIVARAAVIAAVSIGALELKSWLDVGRLSLATTRRMLRFGLPMAVTNALCWLSKRGDNLIIGAMFGPAVAGQYNLAYNLADIPATQIGEQIGDVLLPSFAQMDDHEARKRALTRASGLLALLIFPLAVGLGVIAPTLVPAIFDSRWWAVAPMLVILSVLSVLRPLGWLVGAYLQAMQRTRMVMVLELVKMAGIVGFVVALGRRGPLWACGGIGLAFGANAAAAIWAVNRDDRIPVRRLLLPMALPLACCAPLAITVVLVRSLASSHALAPWLTLVLELGAGAVAYVGAALAFASAQSTDLLSLLHNAVRRRLSLAKST